MRGRERRRWTRALPVGAGVACAIFVVAHLVGAVPAALSAAPSDSTTASGRPLVSIPVLPPAAGGAGNGVAVAPLNVNPIVVENRKTGSSGWRIGLGGYRVATDRDPRIAGYATETSVGVGTQIGFAVSVRPAQPVRIDIYRLGWYAGLGGRFVRSSAWIEGRTQPLPKPNAATGMISCGWPVTWSTTVPLTWTSGLYLATLTSRDGFQSQVPFTVRDDASAAPIIYLQPVTTYQAYNSWPRNPRIGRSLYETGSAGSSGVSRGDPAVAVSFDRPYTMSALSGLLHFDQPFVMWLERAGYDVTYATSVDLDLRGFSLLARHRAIVSVGHDEYWTARMRDAVTAARDRGISIAFFGADNIYWQARLGPAADGSPDRVLVCYRRAAIDPVANPALKTVRWRDAPVGRPEQSLIGSQYSDMIGRPAPFVVSGEGSWVFAGTGLRAGDRIAGLVGGESDRVYADLPLPAHRSFTILSRSPFVTRSGSSDISEAVIYQALSGAWVFDAGTFAWAGLIDPNATPDWRVQRMTANILSRMT